MDMDSLQLIQKLVESFNAVAGELQTLTDRKTILEHKLRYAHEQYQALADKYAPCAPDVAETIAKLQIPPTPTSASFVPLPSRHGSDSSQAQLALFIREGKKVASQLQALADAGKAATSTRGGGTSTRMTSELSTVLEKDFTVEGKKGHLQCPFSAAKHDATTDGHGDGPVDPTTPHPAGDPICAAMLDGSPDPTAAAANSAAAKCPIRYMDKHSPEEIARYVEKHKHELPRSHEVCLRRNQRTEDQIRKLDAKYGNIVSMIEDLSHLHAPMLPEPDRDGAQGDQTSARRVSDWAQNVRASVSEEPAGGSVTGAETPVEEQDPDRTGHFDRPLKEVRVGESPSRPWGISVPVPPPDDPVERATSPPAPVRMPSPAPAETPKAPTARPSRCPFDHLTRNRPDGPGLSEFPRIDEHHNPPPRPAQDAHAAGQHFPAAPLKFPAPREHPQPAPPDSPPPSHQPTFINMTGTTGSKAAGGTPAGVAVPQMVFNGPVFIGYNMEHAIEFMKYFQGGQQQQH